MDIESIVRPVQRNLLIKVHCEENFGYLNLVDVYYRKFNSNAILAFIVIILAVPLIYVCINKIAEKFIAKGMKKFSRKIKLSQSLTAITLMAFANTTPEVISSLKHSGSEEGTLIVLGVGMGVYIFATTVSIAFISFMSKAPIRLPRFMVMKELIFLLVPIIMICVFGFYQTAGHHMSLGLLGVYLVYILTTVYLEKYYYDEEEKAHFETMNHIRRRTQIASPIEVVIDDSDEEVSNERAENDKPTEPSNDKNTEGAVVNHENEVIQNSCEILNIKSIAKEIMEQFFNVEDHDPATILLLLPLNICILLTLPYEKNPLKRSPYRYPMLFICLAVTIYFFEPKSSFGISTFMFIFLILASLIYIEIRGIAKEPLRIAEKVMTVLGATAWVKLFVVLLLDFLVFVAYYFSINEIILFTILLAAGNSISEMLNVGALARKGSGIMAVLATYSASLLNLIAALGINSFRNSQIGISGFDLFHRNSNNHEHHDGSHSHSDGKTFLMGIMAFATALVVFHGTYFFYNGFLIRKRSGIYLLLLYCGFLLGVLAFGHQIKPHS